MQTKFVKTLFSLSITFIKIPYEGALVFSAGYHPHKRTFKTHPKHIFSGMKIDPKYAFLHAFFLICPSCPFQNLLLLPKTHPFFPILHVFAHLNDVRRYISWSWKTTLITWFFYEDDIQLQIQVVPSVHIFSNKALPPEDVSFIYLVIYFVAISTATNTTLYYTYLNNNWSVTLNSYLLFIFFKPQKAIWDYFVLEIQCLKLLRLSPQEQVRLSTQYPLGSQSVTPYMVHFSSIDVCGGESLSLTPVSICNLEVPPLVVFLPLFWLSWHPPLSSYS